MNYILTQLIEATDIESIDRIIRANILSIDKKYRTKINYFAENVKRRIKNSSNS